MEFKRQDSHKKPKLGDKWRRPKGLQSKMRLGFKGYPRSPSAGFGSPRATRGKVKGLEPVVISNVTQLTGLKPAEHGVMVASTVGHRKKVEIVKEALKLKLKVMNIIDAEAYLKKVADALAAKKKAKQEASKTKESKLAERKKKAEEKEKEAKEDKDEIEKKKEEKAEMDKILTSKGSE